MTKDVVACCGCKNKGQTTIKCQVNSNHYYPGDKLLLSCEVNNTKC